jgi:tripartite-type tricarboxylate transporter receptor subunit TctC
MWNRRELLLRSAGLPALFSTLPGLAQAQINGTASIVSGFPAGGMGDNVARPVAEKLRGRYASSIVVESRTGAGGRIAVEYVKRAAPDGLTILRIPVRRWCSTPTPTRSSTTTRWPTFAPVCSTVTYAFSFTAGPGLPAEIKTVADYVKWAKANPKQATYGVPAAGSALHFAGMMLQKAADIEMTSVAYRGGAPLLNDVMGGQVPVSFNVVGEVMPHIRSGKLRSLGVTSAQRSPFLPDVPTFVEQGYKDIAVQEWLGWFLPAKTPAATVQSLNTLVREALQAPDFIAALATYGLEPVHQSPEEFARRVKADYERWGPIVRATGFTAED